MDESARALTTMRVTQAATTCSGISQQQRHGRQFRQTTVKAKSSALAASARGRGYVATPLPPQIDRKSADSTIPSARGAKAPSLMVRSRFADTGSSPSAPRWDPRVRHPVGCAVTATRLRSTTRSRARSDVVVVDKNGQADPLGRCLTSSSSIADSSNNRELRGSLRLGVPSMRPCRRCWPRSGRTWPTIGRRNRGGWSSWSWTTCTSIAADRRRQETGERHRDKVGPGASMAVLFTSGEHSTQVTEDRARCSAAVDTLKGRQSGAGRTRRRTTRPRSGWIRK